MYQKTAVNSSALTWKRHLTLGGIDSKENRLANKLTALVDRGLPKDSADIYVLLNDGLSVKKALVDANSWQVG